MRGCIKALMAGLVVMLIVAVTSGPVSACFDPAQLAMTEGPGDTLSGVVTPPSGQSWDGYVTLTFQVGGEVYTFSIEVNIPKDKQLLLNISFDGTPTLFGSNACEDPGGTTDDPDPVAGVSKQVF